MKQQAAQQTQSEGKSSGHTDNAETPNKGQTKSAPALTTSAADTSPPPHNAEESFLATIERVAKVELEPQVRQYGIELKDLGVFLLYPTYLCGF
jgi:hypothetical protein